jgi:hypothetical protein
MSLLVIIILIVVIVVIPNLIIGAVLTKDGLARQKRITQMKKFRNSVRPKTATFTDEDRRTVV